MLEGAERTALEGLARLTGLLTTPVGDSSSNVKELRRLLSIALADLLMARGEWTSYAVGTRPAFEAGSKQPAQQAIGTTS